MEQFNLLSSGLIAVSVIAQTPALANCSKLPVSLTQPLVEHFLLEPKYVLRQSRNMDVLSHSVSTLLTTNAQLYLPKLVELVRIATVEQKTAIAAGMVSAVEACIAHESQSVRAIREAVRNMNDSEMSKAFAMALPYTASEPIPHVSNSTGGPTAGLAEENGDQPKIRRSVDLGSDPVWNPFQPLPLPDP